jgi:hypothetical protein
MKRLTPQQKTEQLTRAKDILIATIEYEMERCSGRFVIDGVDMVKNSLDYQKQQAEEYFLKRRLDLIQKMINRYTSSYSGSVDLNYGPYLKQKTGFELDIFESVKEHVNLLLKKCKIDTDEEAFAISIFLRLIEKTGMQTDCRELLEKLRAQYSELRYAEWQKKPKQYWEDSKTTFENQDTIEKEVIVYYGPKPKHFRRDESISPDGRKKLRVTQWGDEKNPMTYVELQFPTDTGTIYSIGGIINVEADWKDNKTIVIKTKKEDMEGYTKAQQIRNFDEVVNIEYLEE